MQTSYSCRGCGRSVTVVSQGDLPVQFEDQGVQHIEVNGVLHPLKNADGQTLKCFEDGKPIYWTQPAPPANAPAPDREPVANH